MVNLIRQVFSFVSGQPIQENAMKISAIIWSLFLLTPLSAQTWELGVFAGRQTYNSISTSMPGLTTNESCAKKTALAARLGYSVIDLGPAMLQLTVGYQPSVTTTARVITQGTSVPGQPPTDSGPLDYQASHASVGMMVNFKALLAVGVGIEMRFEKQSLASNSTSYARPWLRANIGMAFPTPVIKPFVGLELAAALSSTSDGLQPIKSLAPKSQIGIYTGIRF
ncbi:hypothetical protein [Geothrix mesophila]|uniref:hypothetical protein n=1 Tax=Geothrix mesophila TaxID=2922723 RepID=UPI001FAE71CE|nr:hypothetical protein [Geothrix sp. SG198]